MLNDVQDETERIASKCLESLLNPVDGLGRDELWRVEFPDCQNADNALGILGNNRLG